ncbi:ABL072Cp [Eremothecium gossypii ATCC 10895]|uniref:Pre-rRNA-processing protein RIX1 n=1 Tax=Eremothecium gossypii (strain ATCC 10895 / CBS 109.51 / FGSC 9923 / NRRL Y-1056) TaxID=284811 RepID=RIX1_EREGS|nr:ABL072Cp [Eremothecium gossypii ATCC 10895]Q75DU5.2 RecName: Full=Pre-rRNA-processing protein RIX1 [Eremothecium gossypii ATCC 10895]AAS50699.2 ABL072Cp [Eremothecium gossypii ATCC 10895]
MTSQVVPLSTFVQHLESCEGYEFRTMIKMLASPAYAKQQLLKDELSVFMAKVLKLLRSKDDYQVWKGCHIATVFCTYNPVVLCSFGGELMGILYRALEDATKYYGDSVQTEQRKVMVRALVKTLDTLMDLIRGKPSLTREALTPHLSAIIPMLISFGRCEPNLSLPVIKKLLSKHSTTFRPHVGKLKQLLTELYGHYQSLDPVTRKVVCDTAAYLHLTQKPGNNANEHQAHHKSFPDEHWRAGLFSVLSQFGPVVRLWGEILDIGSDENLARLLETLPRDTANDTSPLLPALTVDINKPVTLWHISARLEQLTDMVESFIRLPTLFPTRIPLGELVKVSEILLSLTTNYLPLKRGLRRDAALTGSIRSALPETQLQGIRLLRCLSDHIGKNLITYMPAILSSMELFIPLKDKKTSIDYQKCVDLQNGLLQLTALMNSIAQHLGHKVEEMSLAIKLVDICAYIIEHKQNLDSAFSSTSGTAKAAGGAKKKEYKAKTGSMSDLFSHPHKFLHPVPLENYTVVNTYYNMALTHWKLPSTQQAKITKYCIYYSLSFKEKLGYIPQTFIELLNTIVLFPGKDRFSILPIAVHLLKETGDPVFDVLCNPKLPLEMIQIRRQPTSSEDDTATSEAEEYAAPADQDDEHLSDDEHTTVDDGVATNAVMGLNNLVSSETLRSEQDSALETQHPEQARTSNLVPDEASEGREDARIFKKRSSSDEQDPPSKRTRAVAAQTPVPAAVPVDNGEPESDDGSDFEIPEIELSDADEE